MLNRARFVSLRSVSRKLPHFQKKEDWKLCDEKSGKMRSGALQEDFQRRASYEMPYRSYSLGAREDGTN